MSNSRLDKIKARLEHPELFTERDAWWTAVKPDDVEYLLAEVDRLENFAREVGAALSSFEGRTPMTEVRVRLEGLRHRASAVLGGAA